MLLMKYIVHPLGFGLKLLISWARTLTTQ